MIATREQVLTAEKEWEAARVYAAEKGEEFRKLIRSYLLQKEIDQ